MKNICIHKFIYNHALTLNLEENKIRQEFKCEKCGKTEHRVVKEDNSKILIEDISFETCDVFSGFRFTDDM